MHTRRTLEGLDMAKRPRLPRRLFKGKDHISAYQSEPSPTKLMKQVSRDHLDVLQNIEHVLVSRYRQDPGMDDLAASQALRACVGGAEPADPRVAELVEQLRAIRELRADVPDDVWLKALRVVDDSVQTHSDREPGEADYLEFVSGYMP